MHSVYFRECANSSNGSNRAHGLHLDGSSDDTETMRSLPVAPRRRTLIVKLLGSALVLAFLAAGCGNKTDATQNPGAPVTTEPPKPVPGGKIVYGIEADPNGLDATRNAWDPSGLLVADAIFDTLSAIDADGITQPYLAKSFDHNDAYTEWTVNLREGVKFHDDTPFDGAAGVKFFKALMASAITGPPTKYIESVSSPSPLSVTVKMNRPWASFPSVLIGQGGYVLAPKQIDDPEGPLHPIGTGPFKLRDWQVGKQVSLVKNPSYWRTGLPYLDAIDFKVVEDGDDRVAQLQNGSLDVAHASNISETTKLDALPKTGNIVVTHDPGPTEGTFVMFNTQKAPFDDVRVRQAVAYATDLKALAAANGWPEDRLADGPFAPNYPWYAKTDFPRNDLDKAKKLVDEYEAEKGPIKFELSGPFEIALLQQLSDQWTKAGIESTVSVLDFKTNVLYAVTGNFQALLFRYFAASDPDALWHFWTKETVAPAPGISLNFAHLADDQIEEGLTTGRGSADPETRKKAYAKVQQRFTDLVPYVWLYRTDWVIAANSKVHNVKNVTLPDGQAASPYIAGVHRVTETWIDH